ncbi:MAG: TA system VapC family ribonuclease toxin, partial [Wenzhouxiangella sp.]|nr:TA system VapC family ribonuclease toxin [Wenzhouxiangella sp.]
MFVVDTNVLLYAVDADSEFHGPCRELIERARWQAAAWFLTWGICYEFLRVATHPRVYRNPWTSKAGWDSLQVLLASPGVSVLTATRRHAAVLGQCLDELPEARGNLVHDLHTAALMREHGIGRII